MVDSLNALVLVGDVHTLGLKELLHDVVAQVEVFEHTFGPLNEVVLTLSLELDDHGLLGLIARGFVKEQPPAETPEVELLESIFGPGQLEQYQHLVYDLDQVFIRDAG